LLALPRTHPARKEGEGVTGMDPLAGLVGRATRHSSLHSAALRRQPQQHDPAELAACNLKPCALWPNAPIEPVSNDARRICSGPLTLIAYRRRRSWVGRACVPSSAWLMPRGRSAPESRVSNFVVADLGPTSLAGRWSHDDRGMSGQAARGALCFAIAHKAEAHEAEHHHDPCGGLRNWGHGERARHAPRRKT
jgi:hypothetical protein